MCVLIKVSSHTELQSSSGEVQIIKSEQKRQNNSNYYNKTAQKCSVSSENTEK